MKHLSPRWTPEEDAALIAARDSGMVWTDIVRDVLPRRTPASASNRYVRITACDRRKRPVDEIEATRILHRRTVEMCLRNGRTLPGMSQSQTFAAAAALGIAA